MKATELMIGDYITVTPSGMLIQVAAVHKKKVAYHTCTNKLSWVREGLLRPIPITPEILFKNGFNKLSKDLYVSYNSAGDGYIKIRLCDLQDGEWELLVDNYDKFNDSHATFSNDSCFLKVHELQHALKHCGIKKEIEL